MTSRRIRLFAFDDDAGAWELAGVPESGTFRVLPWDPRAARAFSTLFRGREEEEDPGAFLPSGRRGNLQRVPRTSSARPASSRGRAPHQR